MKKIILISLCLIFLFACNRPAEMQYYKVTGPIQGTTYSITYQYDKDLAVEIDSLLQLFNASLSNYDTSSVISKWNNNKIEVPDSLLLLMYNTSKEVYYKTDSAFDITIAPIANLWGFGWEKHNKNNIPDSADIMNNLQYVGMHKIAYSDGKLLKSNPNIKIITNAIAQGLSVDYISGYFNSLNINNYLVEIGGELYCKGVNPQGLKWHVGIDKPINNSGFEDRENQLVINISDKAIATSGNYRKFVEANGKKYGHALDPRTGYPAINELLSVSVVSNSCVLSDAYATGFMVVGLQKSIQIIEKLNDIEVYFIYVDKRDSVVSYYTNGFEKYLNK